MRGGGLRFQLTWYDFTSAYCPKITSPLTKLHIKFFHLTTQLTFFCHIFVTIPQHIFLLSPRIPHLIFFLEPISHNYILSLTIRLVFFLSTHSIFTSLSANSLIYMLINEILSLFSALLLNIKTKYPIIFNFNQISHVRYIFYMLDSIKYKL